MRALLAAWWVVVGCVWRLVVHWPRRLLSSRRAGSADRLVVGTPAGRCCAEHGRADVGFYDEDGWRIGRTVVDWRPGQMLELPTSLVPEGTHVLVILPSGAQSAIVVPYAYHVGRMT